ncbi:MAG: TolC family protein [Bacteroidota bacterium]|nr:TolC family protein [Bacteroidota bacterium]
MLIRKLSALIAIFTAFSFGQSSKNVINLNKAIEMALQRNITVLQSKNTVESQQSTYQSAIGGLLPNLNASGSFNRTQSWQDVTGLLGDQTLFSARNLYSSGISSNVTLFNGFANIANVNRSNSNIRSSEYSYERVKQNIIYQTHQLFLNVVRTHQLLKVNEENLKRSSRQLERIEEMNRVGAISLADVYRQRVTTGNDELALINAQNNFEKAKADLTLFLSIETDATYDFDVSEVSIEVDTSEFVLINAKYQDKTALAKKAIESRPDYQSTTQNVRSAQSSLTIARSGLYPIVSANASYGLSDKEFAKISDNRSLSTGVTLSLPIFSGFQTKNAIEQAIITQRNADDLLKQNERQISVDIQKAQLDIEAAQKQVKVTQASVFSAEMDRKIAEEKYNLGAGTLLDLLIASANYINAQSNQVNAAISYLLSKKQMEYALGTISN